MPAASASNTDSRHAIVTEAAQEPEEPEEPEVEDGEIVDEYEEEELACGVVVCAHPTLDLSRPDDKRVATPNLQSRVLVHIADAAKSFLFMQEKHNANWSTGASHDFQATSRAVERMFAVTKDFLERNSQTRIEVLSPLAILHDIPLRDLHKIWLEFGNLNLRRKARKALKGCPKTHEIDELHLLKVMEDTKEKGRKITEGEKLKLIGDHLFAVGVLEQGKRPTKRKMEEALGKDEVKRLKQQNGGKEPKLELIKEALLQVVRVQALTN